MLRATTSLFICILVITTACSDSHDLNKPAPPLLERYELSSEDSVPEGVAFDPESREFYASSLNGGGIVRIDADGQESVFRPADGRARLVGTKVDSRARRLWVCAQQVDGLDNRVWVLDLASGEMTMEFLLGAITTNGSCNDLVLDNNGAAYVTDPSNPYIYRLDPETGEGAILVTDPLMQDITGLGLGLNGIALTPDESALIVAKFFPAQLLRVPLPAANIVEPVTLTGDKLPPPDGLAVLDGDLYTVSNESVSRVSLNDTFNEGNVVTVPQISGLSTATVAESELYVIKSDVTNFVTGQPLKLPFEIFRVDTSAFDQ